jgi:geranylgeranyl diphosphate synthase, type II
MVRLLTETEKTTLLDETLNGFFERSIDYATRIDPSYRQLWESLYGLIRAGGKRLRPKMVLMAYEAFGGTDTSLVMPVAAAQELLHFCLLIHDDVIDRDYVRYGVANIAGRYKISYSKYVSSPEEQTHYAHSAAILGGDLMLSGAHQLIATSNLSDEDKILAQSYLAHSTFEVAGGELLDTELSFVPYKNGDALKIAKYKTASYSFVSPLMTGASLAGLSRSQNNSLHTYAMSLGIAYQLVDDLLGVFGNEQETGKSTSSDIVEGKRTYMIEHALADMHPSDKTAFSAGFGNPDATSIEIATVKELLGKYGAREKTREKINEYVDEATRALHELHLEQQHYQKFADMVTKVTERSF